MPLYARKMLGRATSLPAVSSGTAKACFALTSSYSCVREQFQMSLAEFEGVQESLSRIGGYTYLSEATRQFTLSASNDISGLNKALQAGAAVNQATLSGATQLYIAAQEGHLRVVDRLLKAGVRVLTLSLIVNSLLY